MFSLNAKENAMNLPLVSEKIKPYFIEQLGCEGLSNHDIAQSTNRSVFHINQMLERPGFKNLCKTNGYNFITAVIKSESVGRPRKLILLETKAAKAAIATGSWDECYRYLDFLFECEKVATEVTPKLMAELKQAQERIAALEAKPKALPKPKAGMIAAPVYENTLWGVAEIVRYEMRYKDTMDEIELLKAKERHLRKLMKGIVNKHDQIIEKMDGRKVISFVKKD